MTNKVFNCTHSNTQQVGEISMLAPTSEEMQIIFEKAECDLPFFFDDSLSGFMTFTKNLQYPIHRWYHFKEGYSPDLVKKILELYPRPTDSPAILDPFCGSGTTLLVAQANQLPAIGVELNPFIAFLSRVKIGWFNIEPEEMEKVLQRVLKDNHSTCSALPELTTFHKQEYFPNKNAYELVRLREAIHRCTTTPEVKDALILALVASLEDVSCLHKDGRLLRYIPRNVIEPKEALYRRAMVIIEDLISMKNKPNQNVKVLEGDARQLDSLLSDQTIGNKFGLILYSPPYLNNFDYSEVYKCELWLTGFINSYKQWRKLRKKTFRSHPECLITNTNYLKDHPAFREVYGLVEQAARCPDIGSYAQRRVSRVMRGYFDDVFLMLKEQIIRLVPGGYIVCIVGNSKHGNLHIPVDTIIAKIGQALGLELVEIRIAKYRLSRNQQSQKLRESLVVFKKPWLP